MRAYWHRRKEWTLQSLVSLRWSIIGRWKAGISNATNATVSGCSRTTVARWIDRYKRTGSERAEFSCCELACGISCLQ